MSEDKLHPTVINFKQFINKHPALREEIRKSGRSWQEYYEKWVLLGEEDAFWDGYKEKDTKEQDDSLKGNNTELFGQLIKLTEKMDINKIQNQVSQLNNTITTIQEAIQQFQESKKVQSTSKDPFNWFRD
ncbi:spore coat protein YlbD [Virgibacillus ainsalahensis]